MSPLLSLLHFRLTIRLYPLCRLLSTEVRTNILLIPHRSSAEMTMLSGIATGARRGEEWAADPDRALSPESIAKVGASLYFLIDVIPNLSL